MGDTSNEIQVAAPIVPAARMPNAITHILGDVADDWHAAAIWIAEVEAASKSRKNLTTATYRQHLAKLRWYCENVGRTMPSTWTLQDVHRFRRFLGDDFPADAVCARRAAAAGAKTKDGKHKETAFVRRGEPGWTPFRGKPSQPAAADVLRFVSALFNAWMKAGYRPVNPLGLTKIRKDRITERKHDISLDLYDLVLETIAREDKTNAEKRLLAARDRFVFEALRGLGLRATEMVDGRMGAFERFALPATAGHYWIFHVLPSTSKGGKERFVPVPRTVMDALTGYRVAFRLPPLPAVGEGGPLLLSPRTVQGHDAGSRSAVQGRRYFGQWGEVTTRQGLYAIVTGRLKKAITALQKELREAEAASLEGASPHWLRHTFAKANLLAGQDVREIQSALGHADLSSTVIYTAQQAIDLIQAWERKQPGMLAREISAR
jgi:integrase/recombinase XerC